ncbi:MAG: hypothetical protein HXO69_01225 [Rothia sp.]|uniref:hypothetical protein n=1 Tax=Rothia sp. (in: high G+C Gram-positive bacteria) TaxID=1885016 RepID=UPI001CB247E0|nr:hypothetical protein [Rothia sp. (in: high G+C Gram-positive bacteria)]MBF1679895.1 hypothetical protein [Rothia sp. (in: high G+C Gram-positive bacteria)]
MSETPRHESNGSGPRQHRKNSGGKDFRSKKGGKNFGGKGGFKRNDRGGKKFDGRRSDSRSKAPRSNGPEAEAPREEVRSIGGRAGYRPAKPKAPEIDDDITGRELDGATFRQLRALEPRNAETVAKHLAMAGRYLDIDPEFALEHAVAASRSAGRIAAVREAVGVAAYVAEDFELALRELRTHRRISGSVDHLALLVDCERALGRLPKAQEMIAEFKKEELPANVRVELAIVESGILSDQGKKSEAVVALQIPQLNPKRAFEYSPRLFSAYSDALANAGRNQEAERWARLAFMAEAALGQGNFAEPEIFDMFGEAGLFEKEEKSVEIAEPADEKAEETAETSANEEASEAQEEAAEGEKTEVAESEAEEAEETSAE